MILFTGPEARSQYEAGTFYNAMLLTLDSEINKVKVYEAKT